MKDYSSKKIADFRTGLHDNDYERANMQLNMQDLCNLASGEHHNEIAHTLQEVPRFNHINN